MIVLPNIDSKIWNIEDRTADIVELMTQQKAVDISLNGEGPCCETLGLYYLLDKLCEKFSYNKKNITIHTCNQLEKHSEYCIVKIPPLYIYETQKFVIDNQQLFSTKTFDTQFKKFGMFIGRSNSIRLRMASHMFDQYISQTALTFHYDYNKTYHRDHLGFDDMLKVPHTHKELECALKLVKASPIMIQDIEESYPMLSPAHLNIAKIYHTFFVEIVCETYFTGNTFYPTEKIWRPLALKTPFIIQGPRDYYNNLRRLGFQTFHQWWDEGFGEDPYDCQVESIFHVVKKINNMTLDELQQMHNEMKPTLEHNYNLLMSLDPRMFKEIFHE
jgi:hypothetical protein